jgi:hypothetical protein
LSQAERAEKSTHFSIYVARFPIAGIGDLASSGDFWQFCLTSYRRQDRISRSSKLRIQREMLNLDSEVPVAFWGMSFRFLVAGSIIKGNCVMKIRDLISQAESLPIEERAFVVDSLLRTLNPPDIEIDKKWGLVAEQRLGEMHSGQVKTVTQEEVFAKLWSDRTK